MSAAQYAKEVYDDLVEELEQRGFTLQSHTGDSIDWVNKRVGLKVSLTWLLPWGTKSDPYPDGADPDEDC